MNQTVEYNAAIKNGIGRMAFVVLSMLAEYLALFLFFRYLGNHTAIAMELTHILAAVLVLYIYGKHMTPSMKIPWIIVIIALPIFGTTLYLLIGLNGSTYKMRRKYKEIDQALLPFLKADRQIYEEAKKRDARLANLLRYIYRNAGYPAYDDTKIDYYDDAKKGIEAQKKELAKAQKFIFMEYHAIEDAQSWHEIEDVLTDRVNHGVEVRVFYDDMGSIGFIDTDFVRKMESRGIKCKVFNAFAPGMNIFLNNRDHRKITVIDGKVGFTGGYNLANEYFHLTEPFGFWKDTGVRLEGSAVNALTVTFLEMWNAVAGEDEEDREFDRYLLPQAEISSGAGQNGFVQPYADSPLDDIAVGEDVYISMAELATDYVWYITPYLIITDEMNHALSLAAKRGVDVRIVTPGIPDKKIIYSVTRSYYNGLVRNGVRIFEYTPGFCHAKMSIADDLAATCGTINMDYRSLYHHFENGCLFADCEAVGEVRADFERVFEESKEVTDHYKSGRGAFLRVGQMLLRLIAPLL
ncbi:MAG: cardiolipin synthase [Lachnospiraceae bacterium]|nr:cardiolipin synthase [Lachnospiraceae bacterium]